MPVSPIARATTSPAGVRRSASQTRFSAAARLLGKALLALDQADQQLSATARPEAERMRGELRRLRRELRDAQLKLASLADGGRG